MEKIKRSKNFNQTPKRKNVQNKPPKIQWQSLEHFWRASIKGGNQLIFESFKAHLRAMGLLNKPEKWSDAAIHFGIAFEDDSKVK